MAALNQCIFRKNLVVCSSVGAKSLGFSGPSSANFQLILVCFIPDFKLKYEDSENIKFMSNQTCRGFFWGHPAQKGIKLHFYTRFAKVSAWSEESKQNKIMELLLAKT